MPGPPAASRTGNGAQGWPALAKRAKEHTRELRRLAAYVTPNPPANQAMLGRLADLNALLAKVAHLVSAVGALIRTDTSQTELESLLDAFSTSLGAASQAINDLAYTIEREMLAQARERDQPELLRSHKRALEDHQTLCSAGQTAAKKLNDLRGHLDRLLRHLERLTNA